MNKLRKTDVEKSNFRYNIITTIVYLIGIIILMQLFNLQIVHGEEYRENSNKKLTREAKIEAARGSITDRTGNLLVSTEQGFSLEMYKTKVEDEQLNNSILLMTNILEKNEDTYIDTFPISIDPFEYHFDSEEELAEWKKTYKIPETAAAEEAFYLFRDKYNIKNEDPKEIRQILAIRYAISTVGYSNKKSIQISKEIKRETAVELQEMSNDLIGVTIVTEPIRKYHMGSLASHILGYTSKITKANQEEFTERGDTYEYENDDKVGQTGVEKVFEEYLRGEDGEKQIDMSVDGTVTGEYTTKEAIGGANIVLTIDANLQRVAEDALERNIEKIRSGGFSEQAEAKGGAVVVANVNTGEILAMASYPDYEPELFYNGISQEKYNEYKDNPYFPFMNKAISAYPPGSIFKMVTAVAALESGVTNTTEKINDNGPYYGITDENVSPPACWLYNQYGYGHGRLNISEAIQNSCNYFFFEVSVRMGIDKLNEYSKYFGLGTKTGIELPGETAGTLAGKEAAQKTSEKWWSAAKTAYASIGQSLNSFSPLQMVKYISMIANGGNKIDMTLVKSVIDSNGTQISKDEIEQFVNKKLQIPEDTSNNFDIKEENIKAVKEGMRAATDEPGGTAYNVFKDFDIAVGGKTGSAETSRKEGADVYAWFAGFAPYDNPEIAVVVMVENGRHGSYTAEVVRDIVSEYFGMNIQNVVENMSAKTEVESFR